MSVLYEEPRLDDYAQRIAATAEVALDALAGLFDVEPPRITITVDDVTDVYNAFAPPLPRPRVVMRALFPTEVPLGYRTEDDLYLLLIHELMHSLQLTYTQVPEDEPVAPRVGLVGETMARFPPMWLLEGIAVWAESKFTAGGRLDDARTLGMTYASARGETLPGLGEVSLATFSDWPAGAARYLYGGQFFAKLIDTHGFEAIVEALREFNAGGPLVTFSQAWRQTTGTDLEEAWNDWRRDVERRAEALAENEHAGEIVTDSGWHTGAPSVSPDGSRIAWVAWPPAVKIGDIEPATRNVGNVSTLIRDRLPTTLDWVDGDTLVYTRVHRVPGSAYSEVFTLDVDTKVERRLTSGARARLPAATPDGCVLHVRDVIGEGSQLKRFCSGDVETLWMAPEGHHIVGTAVSDSGRVALSVWRAGFVDLAVLRGDRVDYLTSDRHQNLEPTWNTDDALVFRSDRDDEGPFDLYQIDLGSGRLTRLTRTVGGAFNPTVAGEAIWYAELGAEGFDIARLDDTLGEELALVKPVPVPEAPRFEGDYAVDDYSPWPSLVPFGWLPTEGHVTAAPFSAAVGAALFGQDDSGRHSYSLNFGYDTTRSGLLAGGHLYLRYDHRRDPLLSAFQGHDPLSFGLQVGVWPHRPHLATSRESAFGVQGDVAAILPLDEWAASLRLEVGVVRLASQRGFLPQGRAEATIGNQRTDAFGYRTRGFVAGAAGVWSATAQGPSAGAWLDVGYYRPLAPGILELAVRAGYRPSPPMPVAVDSFAGFGSLGYRLSLPVELRYGDGLYAAERLSVEPRLRTWFTGDLNVGGDLTLSLDTVLGYGAPVSFSATVGYADAFWYRVGLRVPYW